MVAPIEEQMHQYLIEQEEKRCKALELEYNKNKKTHGKTVKRKLIAKPWIRPGVQALCQEIEMLIMIDEYDYDLTNRDFQNYCSSRGTLHVVGKPESRYWEYFSDHRKSEREYLKDRYFHHAQEVNGTRYQYTDEEINTGWKIIQVGRAKLQDCWELFTRNLKDKGK